MSVQASGVSKLHELTDSVSWALSSVSHYLQPVPEESEEDSSLYYRQKETRRQQIDEEERNVVWVCSPTLQPLISSLLKRSESPWTLYVSTDLFRPYTIAIISPLALPPLPSLWNPALLYMKNPVAS